MKQQGFALIAIIFVLVILAATGLMLSRLTVTTINSQNQQWLLAQAENAALSALEWGIYQLVDGDSCASLDASSLDVFEDSSAAAIYPGFSVLFDCTERSYNDGVTLLEISATATYGSSPSDADYVWRKVDAVVEL